MVEAGEDCCVKVAVHVRPLIGEEKVQGCKDCVSVVPGKPQVRASLSHSTHTVIIGNIGTTSTCLLALCFSFAFIYLFIRIGESGEKRSGSEIDCLPD